MEKKSVLGCSTQTPLIQELFEVQMRILRRRWGAACAALTSLDDCCWLLGEMKPWTGLEFLAPSSLSLAVISFNMWGFFRSL